jgi:hypothetical protein
MKRIMFMILAMVVAAALAAAPVLADVYYSPDKIETTGAHTMWWTGQGATGGELNTEQCDGDLPPGVNPGDPYLLWIFSYDNGEVAGTPTLSLSGTGSGTFTPFKQAGHEFHFVTGYYTPNSSLGACVDFVASDTGGGTWGLKISHGCSGGGPGPKEALSVTKTVSTSYKRTHSWSIDKAVDTENGYTEDGLPKIWLYVDGHGDETATWTVDVTYGGYTDSDFNVSGDITIENTGDLDAVITSIEDLLAGTRIDVDFGVDFPYTLEVGDRLTATYSQNVDSKIEGDNEVTVTTEVSTYSSGPVAIEWGHPTTEVNKFVDVQDYSDLFGLQLLGSLDADDYTAGDVIPLSYDKGFAWADYGEYNCGDYTYDNTAEVIGDDGEALDSADATLKVNVQCYIYETAYAKGGGAICFIPTFSNWGWTNKITSGTYSWPLWAGAGQCDTSKGILVGSVTVKYSGGYVTVTYSLFPFNKLDETHVYAGITKFPQVKQGKKLVDTVAPGQYYNSSPFSNGSVYVIAQAEVGIPDPNFGP